MVSAGADKLAHPFSAAVQVGAHGVDRHLERGRDGIITAVFLVIKDKNRALGFRQREQRSVNRRHQLGVGEQLFGRAGMPVDGVAR